MLGNSAGGLSRWPSILHPVELRCARDRSCPLVNSVSAGERSDSCAVEPAVGELRLARDQDARRRQPRFLALGDRRRREHAARASNGRSPRRA